METMTGKIPILMYHEIYGSQEYQRLKALTNPAYNTSLSGFRKQMAWLHENKVKTLTINELLPKRMHPREKAICLTFDDGWLGNYLNAFPVLQAYGFKASFFYSDRSYWQTIVYDLGTGQTDADLRHVYPIPWSISQAIGRYGRKRDYL